MLFGLILLCLGVFFLLNGIFDWRFDFGDFLRFGWPVGLILIGIYLLRRRARSRYFPEGAAFNTRMFGDVHLNSSDLGPNGLDTEIGIGDIRLDLAGSGLPEKEHRIRIGTGIGDVTVIIPPDIPVSARGSAGIGSVNLLGKTDGSLGPHVSFQSEHYQSAGRKLSIDLKAGIGDIAVARAEK
jgi:hypothetical protein